MLPVRKIFYESPAPRFMADLETLRKKITWEDPEQVIHAAVVGAHREDEKLSVLSVLTAASTFYGTSPRLRTGVRIPLDWSGLFNTEQTLRCAVDQRKLSEARWLAPWQSPTPFNYHVRAEPAADGWYTLRIDNGVRTLRDWGSSYEAFIRPGAVERIAEHLEERRRKLT